MFPCNLVKYELFRDFLSLAILFLKCNLFSHARESLKRSSFHLVNNSQIRSQGKHLDSSSNGPDSAAVQSFTVLSDSQMLLGLEIFF